MRDDDEQLRHYMPLLRRVLFLVAVLTAVPVILWTITAFVRGYVGPPQLPSYRPIAATASIQAPESAASSQDTDRRGQPPSAAQPPALSDLLPSSVQASAATTGMGGSSPTANNPLVGGRTAGGDAKPPANGPTIADLTPAAPTQADGKTIGSLADPATPDGAAQSTGALIVQQQPAAISPPANDPMPAAKPLAGPIPLPRHRPHNMAMAQISAPQTGVSQSGTLQAGVPVPRPRPDAAGPSVPVPETTPGPLDWLQGIFQQHQ